MKKLIFFIVIIFLLFTSCSKDKIVEPALFTINGIVENEKGEKISTDIFLISDDTLKIKSDTDGNFIFENLSEGEYQLMIKDSLFHDMDTLVLISQNVTLNLTVITKTKYDFFPLELGNWWQYNFDYRPSQSSYVWQDGNVKWEVWAKDSIENTIVYQIRERINARVIDKENPDGTVDTSYIQNQLNYFSLVEYNNGFVLFSSANFFNRRILIQRYYKSDISSVILDSGLDWNSHFDNNLIALDEEFHRIKLIKKIGIDYWDIHGSHIGGPKGKLVLIDYEIKE